MAQLDDLHEKAVLGKTQNILHELEIESKSNNYLIKFDLHLNVIERSLSTTKHSSPPITISDSSLSTSPIVIPKATRPPPPVSFPLIVQQVRAMKRFEIERNLPIQTCDTIDRVKAHLGHRLVEMKNKQCSHCLHLSAAETTGIVPKPIYNRDLAIDLLKLTNTIIIETNYVFKAQSALLLQVLLVEYIDGELQYCLDLDGYKSNGKPRLSNMNLLIAGGDTDKSKRIENALYFIFCLKYVEGIIRQQQHSSQILSQDKQQVPMSGERSMTITTNAYSLTIEQPERMSLTSLETITDTLLELMEACMNDIPACECIVNDCISKTTSDGEIKTLLRILVKALESFSDIDLIDSIIMCLTRLLLLLPPESNIHKFMFWIALSILQLEETQLYASGLALLEQNLHTLDHMLNLFENTSTHQQQTLEKIMMDAREPLEWQFKQLDARMGLSFKSNFNFALVGHLIKGFRHPVQSTVVRTTRVLSTLLSIVSKSKSHDKFKVTPTTVPYLAALFSVVEEVRTRCPVKNCSNLIPTTTNLTNIPSNVNPLSHIPQSHSSTSVTDIAGSTTLNVQQGVFTQRLKSWDLSYLDKTRKVGGVSSSRLLSILPYARYYQSVDIENALPRILTKSASTLVQLQQVKQSVPITISIAPQILPETQQTSQASSETNLLLDPNVLTDTSTHALLLTVLSTLIRNTCDENEMRILYEYLSESSIVFPKVFPVIHNLLDAKINSVLSLSHDESILASVQSIIYQMIAYSAGEDASQQQQQLSYLQSCGFGGLWCLAGPFTVSRQNPDNVELFVNWLEAMVETCLPSLDEHEDGSENSGVGSGLTGNNGTRYASLHLHHPFRHHHHYSASSTASLS
ncbi:unnamed protein product [Rotaria sp. Silwood2]|nr:unnamed protein product [Rotaria sp. Silwood2]